MAVEDRLLQVLVSPVNLDINGLAESALRSFAVLEPWCKHQRPSDHQLVAATVEKVMKQADEYIRAIHMSLVTAEIGCEFADNAIELCKFLAKGEAHVEHLQTSLGEMLVKANTAHAQALAMNQQFAGVRSALFQIANTPFDAKEVEQKQIEFASRVVDAPVLDTTNSLRNPKDKAKQVSNEILRRTVTNSFDDIIAQLECAGDDLSDLVDYADNFVNWWNDMKIGLWSLQSSVSLIKLDKSNPLCQEVVRIRWEGFKERHVQYKRRVIVITGSHLEPPSPDIRGRRTEKLGQATKPRLQEEERQDEGWQKEKQREEVEAQQLQEKRRIEDRWSEQSKGSEETPQDVKFPEEKGQNTDQLKDKRRWKPRRFEAKRHGERRQEEKRRLEVNRLRENWLNAKRLAEEWQQEERRLKEEWLEAKRLEGE